MAQVEHAGEQERRVECGQLAVPDAAAGFDIEEVVEEALVSGGVRFRALGEVEEAAELAAGDFRRELADDHAALDDHRDRRQGQADGGDAARRRRVGLVPHQPVVRIGLVQVVKDRGPLQPTQFLVRRCPVQVVLPRRVPGHRSLLRVPQRHPDVVPPAIVASNRSLQLLKYGAFPPRA